ncbi:THAP domain-containing protein 1-like [Leptopilina boulardi]|uniref:THAP domain-containing protein 1-like n=1 Tax=Leptopilina boulardi TaxID=63433 RepID=UPI0021F56C0D|nr:THAP domain-containing protein 1-like [Leptopilina boulardi]
MVISCKVKNCFNQWLPNNNVSFHSFPWKNKVRLEIWLKSIQVKGPVGKYSRICSEHFKEIDFVDAPMNVNRTLKKTAVPFSFENSIKIESPCESTHSQFESSNDEDNNKVVNDSQIEVLINPEIPLNLKEEEEVEEDNEINSTSALEDSLYVEQNTQQQCTERKEEFYQRKIKILQQRLKRRDEKLKKLSTIVNAMKNKNDYNELLEKELKKRGCSDYVVELFRNEMDNEGRNKSGFRYTEKMKKFALTIYSYSPEAYRFLRKKLHLPNESMLRKYILQSSNRVPFSSVKNSIQNG